jgi:ADP-dependent NAD(P)H-hydrate dehydratase / NAD(P)H-hydrate epimerase
MPTLAAQPQRILPTTSYPLHNTEATRHIEQSAASTLPPHTLMQRAGLAVARLACALAPHAQTIWVACGPGNNGGDGFEAAMHLQRWGRRPIVTWCGDEAYCPQDALASLRRARAAGVEFAIPSALGNDPCTTQGFAQPPAQYDLAIDALLGIGAARAVDGVMAHWLLHMHQSAAPVLCIDLPSGLNADTGCYAESAFATDLLASYARSIRPTPRYCLQLLTLKPGCFTAQGKDAAGQVWWDDLGVACASERSSAVPTPMPSAWLLGADRGQLSTRLHATHKGSYGDVAVIGGAQGMTGAALLAARAALHAGAGRVFVGLLDGASMVVDPMQPELMFRSLEQLDLRSSTVVCGCGGGDAVRAVLPQALSQSPRLVLDADALNAVASDTALQTLLIARAGKGQPTILTPHPLEAARLLQTTTAQVQASRLPAAEHLAHQFQCTVILKGAGSILAAPGQVTCINATGNAKLATAGTGDVLAGICGASLAAGQSAFQAASIGTHHHGRAADDWPAGRPLSAGQLAVTFGDI